jgi:cobalt/nickel transport system permease protein
MDCSYRPSLGKVYGMSPSIVWQPARVLFNRVPKGFRLYYGVLAGWLVSTAMHIPDGYLSPATSLVMFLIILPFWYVGIKKLREKINAKSSPLIALLAAFCFIIMMFNVPLPGGTTGHAVGGALAAIILGPEVATIVVSMALIIQAIFFGDGGILNIGANCFNMAVVLPYVAYAVYQWFSAHQPTGSRRRVVGALVGGWIGLTVASAIAGFEFGIQPLLFHAADGTPLYAPYPLAVAIPAMVIPHFLIAGPIEGIFSALVVAYLQRANKPVLEMTVNPDQAAPATGFGRLRALWIILAVAIVATPLGLLAPGTAWGEWGSSQLSALGLSFVPKGLAQLEGVWGAPLARYDLPALGNSNFGYILSAVVGIALVGFLAWLFTTLLAGRNRKPAAPQS